MFRGLSSKKLQPVSGALANGSEGSPECYLGQELTACTKRLAASARFRLQFLVYGIPPNGRGLEELDEELSAQLAALASEGPTPVELQRYKKVRGRGELGLPVVAGKDGG